MGGRVRVSMRKRTPEPTLTDERWFRSVCYPKAYYQGLPR
jgi:hypothetical protein